MNSLSICGFITSWIAYRRSGWNNIDDALLFVKLKLYSDGVKRDWGW